jgi:hypothetical protein
MRKWVGAVYKGYLGALGNRPDQWGKWRAMHSQPVAQAAIHAHAHARGRRKVLDIHARTGLWPIAQRSDAYTYLVPAGMELAALADDDSDGKYTLGRLLVERWCELTEATRAGLAAADTAQDVAEAIGAAFAGSPRVEVCK